MVVEIAARGLVRCTCQASYSLGTMVESPATMHAIWQIGRTGTYIRHRIHETTHRGYGASRVPWGGRGEENHRAGLQEGEMDVCGGVECLGQRK